MVEHKKTIAVITCYHDPDYVRARTLRAALETMPGVELVVIKNQRSGLSRYPDVAWQLWRLKRSKKIDVYLLTFRGQEILPYVLWLAGKQPVIFDEFIVPWAYATQEKHAFSLATWFKHSLARLARPFYRRWLTRCRLILADTLAHAALSAQVNDLDASRYLVLPVGADETVFKPTVRHQPSHDFSVFYYSSGMQPLHGVPTVLAAAELLKDNTHIRFVLSGGKRPMQLAARQAHKQGARVEYHSWIPFHDLLETIYSSDVCLGGPFGDTPQAHRVITGKTYQFLATGAPVIVGSSQVTEEYFQDKDNALVVPQADPQILAEAILWASNHHDQLKTIAARGHELYLEEFSIVSIAKRLQLFIDRLS